MERNCSLKMCEDGGLLLKSGIKIWEEGSFTGKELDDSGLYYFGARYYDPVMGTWLSPDPAMDGLNWYSYCANNPMNYVDPWGLMSDSDAYAASQGNPHWSPHEEVNYTPDKGKGDTSSNRVAIPKGNSIVISSEGEGKVITTPENTGEQQKSPTEVTDDPYTTGPSERGVSDPERVNYVAEKRQIEEKNKVGDQGYDFWGGLTLGFQVACNFDFGYDHYNYANYYWNKGNAFFAIAHNFAALCELGYDTAFTWIAAEYIAGKVGYEGLFVTNHNAVSVSNSVSSGAEQIAEGTKVYRVWGGEANSWGKSWSTVDPGTVIDYRNVAGLPNSNAARFLSEGTLKSIQGITTRASLALDGNIGGLPEVIVSNPSVQIELLRVSGINPEF